MVCNESKVVTVQVRMEFLHSKHTSQCMIPVIFGHTFALNLSMFWKQMQ